MTTTKRILPALAAAVLALAAFVAPGPRTADAATSQLFVSQSCSSAFPGTITVSFSWVGNDAGAVQQWVDLTLFNNDWAPGTFLGAGPFAGSATAFTWDGLIPGLPHYVRINQQLPNGAWDPSPTFLVQTMAGCGEVANAPASSPSTGATATQVSVSSVLGGASSNLGILQGTAVSIAVGTSGDFVVTPQGLQPFFP